MVTEVMAGQRRADARRNRERVLDAAAEVFAEVGLRASVEEIAQRAGVGVGTVCRNFGTKSGLVDAVLERLRGYLAQEARAALDADDAAVGFRDYVMVLADHVARYRVFAEDIAATAGPTDQAAPNKQAMNEALSELVEHAVAAGTIRPDVGPADVVVLLAGIATACARIDTLDARLRRRLVTVVVDGLRPASASPLPGPRLDLAGLDRESRRTRA